MNKGTLWQGVVVAGIVCAIVFGIGFFTANNIQQEVVQNSEPGVITLTIDGLYASEQVNVNPGETVLNVLTRLNAENAVIALGVKEYPGLGTLVESMGGKRNGMGNEYWQYLVNGVMPQIGADQFVLSPGDSVEWHFKASEM